MRKRLLILTFALISVAALTFLIPGSGEVEALPCFSCSLPGTTNTAWGFGATCQDATNDAITKAEAMIPSTCVVCEDTTVIPQRPCDDTCSRPRRCYDPDNGQWRVDVRVHFKCWEDICAP